MSKIEKHFGFLKTTLLGGVVFLLPLVLIIAVVGKGVQIMMTLTEPLTELIPAADSVMEIALIYLIAIIALFLVCFGAGFAAKSLIGKQLFQAIDSKLLIFPGYSLFKARLTGNIGSELEKRTLKPVLVKLDDKSHVGFEVERISGGRATVFLPGAPDPWTGAIIVVKEDQLEPIDAEIPKTMEIFEGLGRGAADLLGKK